MEIISDFLKIIGKLENTKENWKMLERIGKNWKTLRFFQLFKFSFVFLKLFC